MNEERIQSYYDQHVYFSNMRLSNTNIQGVTKASGFFKNFTFREAKDKLQGEMTDVSVGCA